jgi:hypothetical protein
MKIQAAGDKATAMFCGILRTRMRRNIDERCKAATLEMPETPERPRWKRRQARIIEIEPLAAAQETTE